MPASPIDHSTIRKMAEWSGGIPHPRGLGYIIGDGPGGSSQPGSSSLRRPPRPVQQQRVESQSADQHIGAPSGLADAQYRRLIRRFDAMHDINRRFAQDLTQTLDSLYSSQGHRVDWPVFGDHAPYPPPDTPPASPPEEGESDE